MAVVKKILGDSLLIGAGIAFLYIFLSIAITGGYMAVESNKVILVLEIIMAVFLIVVGLDRLYDDLRR